MEAERSGCVFEQDVAKESGREGERARQIYPLILKSVLRQSFVALLLSVNLRKSVGRGALHCGGSATILFQVCGLRLSSMGKRIVVWVSVG